MDNKCEFSQENEFGRLICKIDDNLPCKYQRYCTQKSRWENTKNFSSCGRKNSMALEDKKEIQKKSSSIEKKKYNYKKDNKKKAEVILINKNYIVVKDENGCGMRKYGSFTDVDIGDIIDI